MCALSKGQIKASPVNTKREFGDVTEWLYIGSLERHRDDDLLTLWRDIMTTVID